MHKLAEKIADCMKAKVEGMGIDNINGQDLAELGMWSDIIKDLVCYDKDKKIIEAMDEAEDSEEAMKYIEMYEGYPRKHYRGQMRDSKGRYMRRGYDEPMMDYMPEMYRDMDLMDGKMYYTSANRSQGMNDGGMSDSGMRNYGGSMGSNRGYSDNMRDSREGRNGQSRKTYVETKEMHKGNTPEDKQAKQKELDKWLNDFTADVKELVGDMSAEEKTLLKTRLNNLQSSL